MLSRWLSGLRTAKKTLLEASRGAARSVGSPQCPVQRDSSSRPLRSARRKVIGGTSAFDFRRTPPGRVPYIYLIVSSSASSFRVSSSSSFRSVAILLLRFIFAPQLRPLQPGRVFALVKKDARYGPRRVRRKVGDLARGPLVPLCGQTEAMYLRREEIVQNEDDRLRTTLQV